MPGSSPSALSLSGRTVLVTGATRGVGRGLALGLGELGAHVVITGRTANGPSSLESTASAVRAFGTTCSTYVVDHSDEQQITDFFNTLHRDLSREGRTLDVLVNNAYSGVPCIAEHSEKQTPFWEMYSVPGKQSSPGAVWDCINKVCLRGNYIASVLATRLMTGNENGGIIVSISSIGSTLTVFNPAYCAGKAATDRLSTEFAVHAPPNVRFVTFYPGIVSTRELKALSVLTEGSDVDSFPSWNFETPLFVGRTLGAFLASATIVARAHGRIVIGSEIGHKFNIKDENGFQPLSIRSLRFLLQMFNPFLRHSPLRYLIPPRLNIPWWFIHALDGAKKYC